MSVVGNVSRAKSYIVRLFCGLAAQFIILFIVIAVITNRIQLGVAFFYFINNSVENGANSMN